MTWSWRTPIALISSVQAIAAVFEELDLSKPSADMMASVVAASGSEQTESYLPRDVSLISEAIKQRAKNINEQLKRLPKE